MAQAVDKGGPGGLAPGLEANGEETAVAATLAAVDGVTGVCLQAGMEDLFHFGVVLEPASDAQGRGFVLL